MAWASQPSPRKDSKPKERRAEFEMAAVLGAEPRRLLSWDGEITTPFKANIDNING